MELEEVIKLSSTKYSQKNNEDNDNTSVKSPTAEIPSYLNNSSIPGLQLEDKSHSIVETNSFYTGEYNEQLKKISSFENESTKFDEIIKQCEDLLNQKIIKEVKKNIQRITEGNFIDDLDSNIKKDIDSTLLKKNLGIDFPTAKKFHNFLQLFLSEKEVSSNIFINNNTFVSSKQITPGLLDIGQKKQELLISNANKKIREDNQLNLETKKLGIKRLNQARRLVSKFHNYSSSHHPGRHHPPAKTDLVYSSSTSVNKDHRYSTLSKANTCEEISTPVQKKEPAERVFNILDGNATDDNCENSRNAWKINDKGSESIIVKLENDVDNKNDLKHSFKTCKNKKIITQQPSLVISSKILNLEDISKAKLNTNKYLIVNSPC